MWSQGPVKSKLHHEGLCVRKLRFLAAVERLHNKQVLAEYALNNLKMLVGVVGLAEGLLSRHLILPINSIIIGETYTRVHAVVIHLRPTIQALFFLFGALFEKHFAEYIFFLLVRIIILYVVIMRLVKNAV